MENLKQNYRGLAATLAAVCASFWMAVTIATSSLVEPADKVLAQISRSDLPMSVAVKSHMDDDVLSGTVMGILDRPYPALMAGLDKPSTWCEIVTLHINVKACTFELDETPTEMNIYNGRSHYQPAEEADEMEFDFQVPRHDETATTVKLTAADGPWGTEDYLIVAHFEPTDDDRTLVYFRYDYELSWRAKLALSAYLGSSSEDKVGFTKVGADDGSDGYIDGMRGMAERNAVRYYLAMAAYLGGELAKSMDDETALRRWAESTTHFKRQLGDIDVDAYLEAKRREFEQQRNMQVALGGERFTTR